MTEAEIKSKWIKNAIEYFVGKTLSKNKYRFSYGIECNGYTGRSFYQFLNNMYIKGFYKWCAVEVNNNLVIFYCGNSKEYFVSKYDEDPPAYSFVLEDTKSDNLSNEDKVTLDKVYDEMCEKINGMNEKVFKAIKQAEKEIDACQDMDSTFDWLESNK